MSVMYRKKRKELRDIMIFINEGLNDWVFM